MPCISTHEKTLIKFWPILMFLYVKSRFVFVAHGVQLDNGVDPPWSGFDVVTYLWSGHAYIICEWSYHLFSSWQATYCDANIIT